MSFELKIINATTREYDKSIIIEDELVQKNCSHLLSKAVRILNNNLHICRSAHYKCVSGIKGSSRKIRPQKRMGRSRQGEARNIHMRGGAVKFGYSGDKERDNIKRYRRKLLINKKEKNLISKYVINNKLVNNLVSVIDFNNYENMKTKFAKDLFSKFFNTKEYVYTLVYDGLYNRSISNLSFIRLQNVSSINIMNLLKNKNVIFDLNSVIKFLDKLKIKYQIK